MERLAIVGRALWRAVLIGNPPPALSRLSERMHNPRPGDLVMEITVFSREFDPDSVGTLLRIEGEFPDDNWVVEPLHAPGTEQGWLNAQFIALPPPSASPRGSGSNAVEPQTRFRWRFADDVLGDQWTDWHADDNHECPACCCGGPRDGEHHEEMSDHYDEDDILTSSHTRLDQRYIDAFDEVEWTR